MNTHLEEEFAFTEPNRGGKREVGSVQISVFSEENARAGMPVTVAAFPTQFSFDG